MIVHNIRRVEAKDDEIHFAVDLEWSEERALYRFTIKQGEPLSVTFSPRAGGLPLAFYRENDWAKVHLCKLVEAVHRGVLPSFPVHLAREAA